MNEEKHNRGIEGFFIMYFLFMGLVSTLSFVNSRNSNNNPFNNTHNNYHRQMILPYTPLYQKLMPLDTLENNSDTLEKRADTTHLM